MADLAIKGHVTRGKEVIEILEMLGGVNKHQIDAIRQNYVYFIDTDNIIRLLQINQLLPEKDIVYSLEEFEENFPYKVGDKVYIYVQNDDLDGRCEIEVAEISSMRWNPACCKIAYKMKDIYREFYEEEIKCKVDDNAPKNMEEKQVNVMKNILPELLKHIKTTPKEELEREFKEIEEWSNVGPTVEEFMDFCNKVNKKPKYPTTYDECCNILGIEDRENGYCGYEWELLGVFQKLYICRNAYWKIAGELMGLDKLWKQDYDDRCFIIANSNGNIHTYEYHGTDNIILAFPTKELRDTFYENFKDLIEQCKEFL